MKHSKRLSAARRKKLKAERPEVFGVPGKAPGSGSYPMPDRRHALAALRLLHNASPEEQKRIRAKANRILGKTEDKGLRA